MRRVLASFATAVMLAGDAIAGPLEDALAVRDYATALELILPDAETGVPVAQVQLGDMYDSGLGIPVDHAEAMRWYRRAAEDGDAFAQWLLGTKYIDGINVVPDEAQGVKWFRRSANQGYVAGQYRLGLLYRKGKFLPQDAVLAHMWFNLAAEQEGTGRFDIDPRWRLREREIEIVSVEQHAKWARQSQYEIARTMTPDQIAEAQRLAQEWKPSRN
jgi:TPR repeat protein